MRSSGSGRDRRWWPRWSPGESRGLWYRSQRGENPETAGEGTTGTSWRTLTEEEREMERWWRWSRLLWGQGWKVEFASVKTSTVERCSGSTFSAKRQFSTRSPAFRRPEHRNCCFYTTGLSNWNRPGDLCPVEVYNYAERAPLVWKYKRHGSLDGEEKTKPSWNTWCPCWFTWERSDFQSFSSMSLSRCDAEFIWHHNMSKTIKQTNKQTKT